MDHARPPIDRRLLDFKPELELPAAGNAVAPWRDRLAARGTADEYGEMDFAARLLEARSADELAPVLADLVGPAADARQRALRLPVLRVLHRAARMIFPLDASRAPADLKRKASSVFGLELEGLSPEDKEFEVARHFVRLAADAAHQALARAGTPGPGPGGENAAGNSAGQAAQRALMQAARRSAPGLLRQGARGPAAPAQAASGRIQTIDLQAGRYDRSGFDD
ncbi:MAG TPA: hypothetical protein VF774_02850 [Pseudoduganella sp.]